MKSNKKHGLRKHRLYNAWNSMMQRCNNPKNPQYKHYGGRGIRVCDEWLDVSNFIEDMHPAFKEGLSLDRINNNGNYEPSNCRWATMTVQGRNTRKIRSNNSTGYRGVSWDKEKNKYRVTIKINNKSINVGSFITDIEAAKAYDQYIVDNNLEHTKNF